MRLIFTSGTARGGTNFRTLILNNHPDLRISLDPFIPLFRFFRDSLIRTHGNGVPVPESGVLDDYYYSDSKLRVMRLLQSADPDISFDMSQWEPLKAAIASRMTLASVNLIEHLDLLPAPTFREVFHNTMKVVAATRPGELAWVGFNDNWAAEFFPLVAQLVPDAKFILHIRDPRAVVHSSEFAEPDPAKHPTVVSFARHLRKYNALSQVLPSSPHLRDRMMVTRYEPFIADPEAETRRVTDFLGVDYHPEMIDVLRFKKADGTQWASDWKIYQDTVDIWRRDMPRPMAELTEFVCDPDMRLNGYIPEVYDEAQGLSQEAFDYALENARTCLGWRTDFPEFEQTLGGEFVRKRLLAGNPGADSSEVARNFLFGEVFVRIQKLLDNTGTAYQWPTR